LVEARGGGDEIFGEERLKALAAEHRGLDAEPLCERLLGSLRSWSRRDGSEELEDDLTLVVVQVH